MFCPRKVGSCPNQATGFIVRAFHQKQKGAIHIDLHTNFLPEKFFKLARVNKFLLNEESRNDFIFSSEVKLLKTRCFLSLVISMFRLENSRSAGFQRYPISLNYAKSTQSRTLCSIFPLFTLHTSVYSFICSRKKIFRTPYLLFNCTEENRYRYYCEKDYLLAIHCLLYEYFFALIVFRL